MLKLLWSTFKWIGIVLLLLSLLGWVFMHFAPQFGAKPTKESLKRISVSPNQRNGKFQNRVETTVDTRKKGESMDIHLYLFPPRNKNPDDAIPSQRFDISDFNAGDFVWFGHSTVLLRTNQLTVLTDPIFNRASPIPIGGKPFAMTEDPNINDIPDVDVVIISHDHYDHLDSKAMSELASRTAMFLVPLGVQSHLERWGVPSEKIIELDWYEAHTVKNTEFTLTPTRHFSGRGLTNRNTTLWGAWVIKNPQQSIYFSGDSGYFDEFKKVGEQYGPFDIAFIENGAYDKGWSEIHMMPEQSVQAAIDLKAELFFPIHWGKFDLAKHPWTEPIERAIVAANKKELPVVAPLVGQIFTTESPPFEPWWR